MRTAQTLEIKMGLTRSPLSWSGGTKAKNDNAPPVAAKGEEVLNVLDLDGGVEAKPQSRVPSKQ
jgi:hypothetical protein